MSHKQKIWNYLAIVRNVHLDISRTAGRDAGLSVETVRVRGTRDTLGRAGAIIGHAVHVPHPGAPLHRGGEVSEIIVNINIRPYSP